MSEHARGERHRGLTLTGFLLVVGLAFEDTPVEIDIAPMESRDQGCTANVASTGAGVETDENEAGNML
jgi:hypothetical protein